MDFPEIAGEFPSNSPPFGGIRSRTNLTRLPFHIEYHRETSSLVPISFTRIAIGVAGHRQPNGMEIGRGRVAVVGGRGKSQEIQSSTLEQQ